MKRAAVVTTVLLSVSVIALIVVWRNDSVRGVTPTDGEPAGSEQTDRVVPNFGVPGKDSANHAGSRSILITVLDLETNAPIENEQVEITLMTEEASVFSRQTNGMGRVRLGPYNSRFLTEGVYLSVSCAARETTSSFVHAVPAKDDERELQARVSLSMSAVVQGRILLPPGVPGEAARLWMRRSKGPLIDHYCELLSNYNGLDACEPVALTPKGHFRLLVGDPLRAEWLVAVAHEGARWSGRAVSRGSEFERVEIALSEIRPGDLAFVRLHVRTSEGEPAHAYFHSRWLNGKRMNYGVSVDASCELEHVLWFLWQPGGMLYLQVDPENDDKFGHVVMKSLSSDLTDIDVTLPRGRVLKGTVRTVKGDPVADAVVSARLIDIKVLGQDIGYWHAEAESDAHGRFMLQGLGDAPYMVTVMLGDGLVTARRHRIALDQETLDIVARPSISSIVRVVDAAGAPVAGAVVLVRLPPLGIELDRNMRPYDPESTDWEELVTYGRTLEDGSMTVDGLDDGQRYAISIRPPAERPELGRLEIHGWTTREETFRLPQGLSISGRVLTPDGQPVQGRWVTARNVDGSDAGGRRFRYVNGGERFEAASSYGTGQDGVFRIYGLPPGRYKLSVDGGVGDVEANARDRDVVLRAHTQWNEIDIFRFNIDNWPFEDRGAWAYLSVNETSRSREQVDPSGVVQFDYVAGFLRCDLWIGGLKGGRFVWKQGIKAVEGYQLKVDSAEISQGGTIRGRVVAPPGAPLDSWSVEPVAPVLHRVSASDVRGGVPCHVDLAKHKFELTGVPPGSWTVRVVGVRGNDRFRGEAKGSPGEEVVVELK